MNIIKLLIATALLLACYQSRAQQVDVAKSSKKKRMFFYPTQETPSILEMRNPTLYPNPASDRFSIDLPVKKGEFDLEIHGRSCLRVLSQKWNGGKIDVSQFPAGIYIVTLRKDKQYYSQKLVVKRE